MPKKIKNKPPKEDDEEEREHHIRGPYYLTYLRRDDSWTAPRRVELNDQGHISFYLKKQLVQCVVIRNAGNGMCVTAKCPEKCMDPNCKSKTCRQGWRQGGMKPESLWEHACPKASLVMCYYCQRKMCFKCDPCAILCPGDRVPHCGGPCSSSSEIRVCQSH
jgi:hypothetical protein